MLSCEVAWLMSKRSLLTANFTGQGAPEYFSSGYVFVYQGSTWLATSRHCIQHAAAPRAWELERQGHQPTRQDWMRRPLDSADDVTVEAPG